MGLVSSNACRGYDYQWLIDLSSSRGSVRSASGRTCTLLCIYVCACQRNASLSACYYQSIKQLYMFSQ